MKLFRFREIQRGVQRENPSGSLSAVRQGGLGAASPVSKGNYIRAYPRGSGETTTVGSLPYPEQALPHPVYAPYGPE